MEGAPKNQTDEEEPMNAKRGMVGMLLLALALVVAACGAAAPEAAMETGSSAGTGKQSAAVATMEQEGDDPMEKKAGDGDGMADQDAQASMDKEVSAMKESHGEADAAGDRETMDADSTMDTAGDQDTMDVDGAMSDESMMGEAGTGDEMEAASDQESMEPAGSMGGEVAMDLPAWFSAELIDVSTDQMLTVADLKGQVVLVETMAIWCSNCLRQQQEVKALHEALGEREDLVTLVLDVDANEKAGNLKEYAARHGFTWTYAIAPREVAREIGQLYGDQFLNPPSTPMLIVDRQGEVHLLPFGRKSAQDLAEALAPFLDAGM